MSRGRLLPAILLVSAVGLAYQVVLTRIFSIAQWHHFAYMIISVAMVGFAVSGTLLGVWRERIRGREAALFRLSALLLPLSIVGCYAASQAIPFETFELVADTRQLLLLFLLYLVLSVPFLLVSTCVTLGFLLLPRGVGRVYFHNMLGSGLGAAGVVAALFGLAPSVVPVLLAAAAAAAFLLSSVGARRWLVGGTALLAAGALWLGADGVAPIRVSEYKGLSYALDLPDAEVVATEENPVSRITAVRSSRIRETPGQLAGYPMGRLGRLPEQVGLYFDAGAVSPVHRFEGSLESFAWLDYVTSALPYRLLERPRVAVVGAGGGTEVLSALVHGARDVTALEVNPGVFSVVRGRLGEFSGGLYDRSDVRPVVAEGRGFLQATRDSFDLVQIALLDSFNAASAGVHALSESYLYTREALSLYLRRLTSGGVLSVTRWLRTPPRDLVRLFATMAEAAEETGYEDPARHLAFIRSWNTGTVVFSRRPLGEGDVAAIRGFAEGRGFDRAWHPGLEPRETNRYTVLGRPTYHDMARRILAGGEEREELYREYPFHVRPATDDRPYYFRFVRWKTLPRLARTLGRDWINYVEGGYLVLAGTVGQAAAAALLLVLLPLLVLGPRAGPGGGGRAATVLYFGALGLSYMFLEIAFIQKFMLFLHHPVYAVAVVLTAFLAFSGLGSWFADRWEGARRRLVRGAVAGIGLLGLLYYLLLPPLFSAWAGWADPLRIAASVLLLAPLAFLMGVPFPAGLQTLSDRRERLVPWAWGVNGAASVVGAALAALLAVHAGYAAVTASAVLLYAAAAGAYTLLPGPREEGRGRPSAA